MYISLYQVQGLVFVSFMFLWFLVFVYCLFVVSVFVFMCLLICDVIKQNELELANIVF